MIKNKLIFVLGILFLLSSCSSNTKTIVEKKDNIKIVVKENKNIDNIGNIKLSTWDKGVLDIVFKKNDIKYCNDVKNISKQDCEKIYKYELDKLKEKQCDKLRFKKQECYDNLYLEKLDCKKISSRSLQVNCNYEKGLKKALKENDKNFCKQLPRTFKNDCIEKFNKTIDK